MNYSTRLKRVIETYFGNTHSQSGWIILCSDYDLRSLPHIYQFGTSINYGFYMYGCFLRLGEKMTKQWHTEILFVNKSFYEEYLKLPEESSYPDAIRDLVAQLNKKRELRADVYEMNYLVDSYKKGSRSVFFLKGND